MSTGPVTVSTSILTAALTSAPQPETAQPTHHPTMMVTEDGEYPDDDENDLRGAHIVADIWNYNNSTTLIILHFLIDGWEGRELELVNGHTIH